MCGYPQFSFWISITLVEICFTRMFSQPRKNSFELVGTVLKTSLFHFRQNAYFILTLPFVVNTMQNLSAIRHFYPQKYHAN